MFQSQDEFLDAIDAALVRLRDMFGEGMDFQFTSNYRIIPGQNTGSGYLGIHVLFPEDMLPPGLNVPLIVRLDGPMLFSTVPEIADRIAVQIQEYLSGRRPPDSDALTHPFTREEILDQVTFIPMALDRFPREFGSVPHHTFLDLAGLYTIILEDRHGLLIPDIVQKAMRISDDEFLDAARKNTLARYGIALCLQSEHEKTPAKRAWWKHKPFSEATIDTSDFYSVTNMSYLYGSSLLMIPEALEALGEKAGMDYYIFPCGVHELELYRDDGSLPESTLKIAAQAAYLLSTKYGRDLPLTSTLYHYSRSKKKLTIV